MLKDTSVQSVSFAIAKRIEFYEKVQSRTVREDGIVLKRNVRISARQIAYLLGRLALPRSLEQELQDEMVERGFLMFPLPNSLQYGFIRADLPPKWVNLSLKAFFFKMEEAGVYYDEETKILRWVDPSDSNFDLEDEQVYGQNVHHEEFDC